MRSSSPLPLRRAAAAAGRKAAAAARDRPRARHQRHHGDARSLDAAAARPGRGAAGGGTLVAARQASEGPAFKSAPSDDRGVIDLSVNRPATSAYLEALAALLPRLSRHARYAAIQDYHPPEGPLWARAAVADWMKPVAGDGDPGRVVLTGGRPARARLRARRGAERGDVVVADAVTYQGINALCRSLGSIFRGWPWTVAACAPMPSRRPALQPRPRAVFLVPSLHNPTTITLAEDRRQELVGIARRHNVIIIEDDVYRPLLDDPPPSLASLEPELTVHISGLSKCVAPGLRLGFVIAPALDRRPGGSGAAHQLLEHQPAGGADRHSAAGGRSGGADHRKPEAGASTPPGADRARCWAASTSRPPPPRPMRGCIFPSRGAAPASRAPALQRGVGVLPGDAFAVGREPVPHAVRINIGAARSQGDLRRALATLAELLRPATCSFRASSRLASPWPHRAAWKFAVVGAGVVGLAVALRLAAEGKEVLLLDPERAGFRSLVRECRDVGGLCLRSGRQSRRAAQPCRNCFSTMDSPFSLRWQALPQLAPWLARFVRQSLPAAGPRQCRRARRPPRGGAAGLAGDGGGGRYHRSPAEERLSLPLPPRKRFCRRRLGAGAPRRARRAPGGADAGRGCRLEPSLPPMTGRGALFPRGDARDRSGSADAAAFSKRRQARGAGVRRGGGNPARDRRPSGYASADLTFRCRRERS